MNERQAVRITSTRVRQMQRIVVQNTRGPFDPLYAPICASSVFDPLIPPCAHPARYEIVYELDGVVPSFRLWL